MPDRILIVDDHVAIRRGLRDIVQEEFPNAEVMLVETEQRAIEAMQAAPFDVAILDLNLPGRGGLDLLKALKEVRRELRVLIYSMHPEDQFGIRALRSGADGYLTKDSSAENVVFAIRALLSGQRYVSAQLADQLVRTVADRRDSEGYENLSNREFDILREIAAGKSLTDIADQLNLSAKTVSTYRSRILEKLKLNNNSEIVRYALRKRIIAE